jgi:hypothetical protein
VCDDVFDPGCGFLRASVLVMYLTGVVRGRAGGGAQQAAVGQIGLISP